MRDYGKVSPQFWIGSTGRKLREAGPETLLVSLHLVSNPHANMLGLYYLPKIYIAHETGFSFEGASEGLARAIKAGFCDYDEPSEIVWVREMARFQIAERLDAKDNRCLGIQREYDALPNNPFLSAFYDKYAVAFHLKNPRGSASPSEAPSESLGSQEQEQEQENTFPQTPFADVSPILPEETKISKPTEAQVDGLYGLYPKKRDKIDAKKSIRKAVGVVMGGDSDHPAMALSDALDYLSQRVALYAQSVQGCDRDFIKYPATWFNAGSYWDDEGDWSRSRRADKSSAPSLPSNYVSASEKVRLQRDPQQSKSIGGVQ